MAKDHLCRPLAKYRNDGPEGAGISTGVYRWENKKTILGTNHGGLVSEEEISVLIISQPLL